MAKPGERRKALAVSCTGIVLLIGLMSWMDFQFESMAADKSPFHLPNVPSLTYASYALMTYITFAIVLVRMRDGHVDVAYELMWGCNVGMIVASWGMYTKRTALVGTAIALVCLDQVLWWFDIAGRLMSKRKKWPIGVAAYLEDPMVAWIKKLTCVHHLFFLPLCFWATWGMCLPFCCWYMEVVLAACLAIFCRNTSPMWVIRDVDGLESNGHGQDHGKHDPRRLYCNVNMSHAMWRDVKVKWLHRFDESSAFVYIPFLTASLNIAVGPLFAVVRFILCLVS